MEFFEVDIDSITSPIPRSNFSESELDRVADLILELGGIIDPLILKSVGFEKYEVIARHFEYYTAVRAFEKDHREGEVVNAFVVSNEDEEKLALTLTQDRTPVSNLDPVPQTALETRLLNLEVRMEKINNELKQEMISMISPIDERVKQLETLISPQEKDSPLDLMNRLSQGELEIKLKKSRIATAEKFALKKSRIATAEKFAKLIVDARTQKPNQRFEGYQDVIQSVKGLGEKTMIKIIDNWS